MDLDEEFEKSGEIRGPRELSTQGQSTLIPRLTVSRPMDSSRCTGLLQGSNRYQGRRFDDGVHAVGLTTTFSGRLLLDPDFD